MTVPASSLSSVIVRQAVQQDSAALGRLGALLMDLHHDLDTERFIPSSQRTPALYAEWLDAQRQRKDTVVLVAEGDGVPLGYAYAGLEGSDVMALRGPAGVIYDLIVEPAHRRRGIGRMLIEADRTQLAGMGAPRLILSTAAKNMAAQRLFASLGYRATMVEMTLGIDASERPVVTTQSAPPN